MDIISRKPVEPSETEPTPAWVPITAAACLSFGFAGAGSFAFDIWLDTRDPAVIEQNNIADQMYNLGREQDYLTFAKQVLIKRHGSDDHSAVIDLNQEIEARQTQTGTLEARYHPSNRADQWFNHVKIGVLGALVIGGLTAWVHYHRKGRQSELEGLKTN